MIDFVRHKWKRKPKEPIYLQIADFIKAGIENGDISIKEKLPGHRKLAEMFGVSINTVLSAMQILQMNGTIKINAKKRSEILTEHTRSPNWSKYTSTSLYNHQPHEYNNSKAAINLSVGMAKDYYIKEYFNRVLKDFKLPLDAKCSILGPVVLRKEISSYLKKYNIEANHSEIMITQCVSYGLNTLFISLLGHGSNLILPHPCYLSISHMVSTTGTNVIKIPMDKEGIEIDKLSKIVHSHKNCILCIPSDRNIPTGTTISLERKKEILKICEEFNVPIIEHTFMPLGVYDESFHSFKSLDTQNVVIHVSQLSPVGMANPWIGWIIADRNLLNEILKLRFNLDGYQSCMAEFAFLELLKSGLYDEFISNIRQKNMERRTLINKLLNRHLADIASWESDNVDTAIWMSFKNGVNTSKLNKIARTVTFHPGKFYDKNDTTHIYINPVAHCLSNLEYGFMELRKLVCSVAATLLD